MVGTGMDQTKTNQTQQKWSYIFGSYTCWDSDDDELFIKMHNLPFRPVIIAIIISGSEMLHERLLCVDVRLWMEVESNRIEFEFEFEFEFVIVSDRSVPLLLIPVSSVVVPHNIVVGKPSLVFPPPYTTFDSKRPPQSDPRLHPFRL